MLVITNTYTNINIVSELLITNIPYTYHYLPELVMTDTKIAKMEPF